MGQRVGSCASYLGFLNTVMDVGEPTSGRQWAACDHGPGLLRAKCSRILTSEFLGRTLLGGTIGTDRDILFVRSIDDGATSSSPAPLNTTAAADGTSDNDTKPDLTAGSGGVVVASWSSVAPLGTVIARSIDGGATWSAPLVDRTEGA